MPAPHSRRDAAGLEGKFHELLTGWAHVFEALPEGDDGESCVFEVLAHLDTRYPGGRSSCFPWYSGVSGVARWGEESRRE